MAHVVVLNPVATKVTPRFVRYHDTKVVVFHSDGSVTLNSGGFRTATTKHRMNQFGRGVRVFQRNRVWFVKRTNGEVLRFFDGMRVNP